LAGAQLQPLHFIPKPLLRVAAFVEVVVAARDLGDLERSSSSPPVGALAGGFLAAVLAPGLRPTEGSSLSELGSASALLTDMATGVWPLKYRV
jgi:hypothetical protein